MSALGRFCCKTILSARAGNIDSRTAINAQHRFKNCFPRIRLLRASRLPPSFATKSARRRHLAVQLLAPLRGRWYKNPSGEIIARKRGSTSMNPNKALWEKGDFTRIAESMRESGEALVQRLGITKGLKVLDLGCGDGTTALPEARLGADVLGVDIARNLVEAGNRRALAEGLTNCRFQEGDASNLNEVADRSFDLVVSIFGAMFAPKPFDVAREMVRVTRPGGRIVMGNWIPNDPTFVSQLLKISSSFMPPPPEGFVSPMTWGVDTHIIERFGEAGVAKEKISMAKDTYHFIAR